MKNRIVNIILILILVAGLSLLIYPSFSNYWNSLHQSRAIASYVEQVANLDDNKYDEYFAQAEEYNKTLLGRGDDRFQPTEEELEIYNSVLNVGGSGVMGYLEIPEIKVSLPIYHTTEDVVLQIAAGHVEGTSLPVGGKGSHSVLSGHRGLPSAKLFTDLDKLQAGDLFMLNILDRTLTYEIDQVLIVKPYELEALAIDPNQDYCTLVTCTPYGINTHRILVRGHRVENIQEEQAVRVTADALQIEPILVAPVVAAPMLVLLLIFLLVSTGIKKRKNRGGTPHDETDI